VATWVCWQHNFRHPLGMAVAVVVPRQVVLRVHQTVQQGWGSSYQSSVKEPFERVLFTLVPPAPFTQVFFLKLSFTLSSALVFARSYFFLLLLGGLRFLGDVCRLSRKARNRRRSKSPGWVIAQVAAELQGYTTFLTNVGLPGRLVTVNFTHNTQARVS